MILQNNMFQENRIDVFSQDEQDACGYFVDNGTELQAYPQNAPPMTFNLSALSTCIDYIRAAHKPKEAPKKTIEKENSLTLF